LTLWAASGRNMYEHLIFYDHECPFCHKQVRNIIEMDVNKRFVFAPLGGETAQEILIGPHHWMNKANSIVLVEYYASTDRRFWVRAKAILRIFWLNGNGWGVIGWLSFLPSQMGDIVYRYIAEHRHQYKLQMPKDPGPKERFLP